MSKSNQTRHGVSHLYLESKTKKNFAIACLGKKSVFHTEIFEFRYYRILKIGIFHRVKKLFKSNQTQYGVSHVYLKSKTKRFFCYSLPRKNVSISYENLRISLLPNFKNKSFSSGQGVVQIKPNLVWSIPKVGRLCNKKNFWNSLPRKKVSFSYVNLRLFRIHWVYWILKIGLFNRIKELFKVNQNNIPDYQYYLDCNAKRMVRLTFLEKSSFSNRKYRLICLFYFQKYKNSIGSRSCSKWTKLIWFA